MKKAPKIMALILAALLLSACTPAAIDPVTDSSTAPTVQDIFHETTTPSTSVSTTENPAENPTKPSSGSIDLGSLGIGPEEWLSGENGPYMIYEGGEMKLPFKINTTGSIADNGVGILLFIDGQPQPYKTEEEPEYAYLHTFYPEPGEECIYNFYFTPITGKQDDDLEIYAASVLYPTYSLAEGVVGMVYTSGSVVSGFRLKYQETPPEDIYPEKQLYLSETTVSFTDTTASEIYGWSDDDLREVIDYKFYVNETDDMHRRMVYGVSADEPVSLRYEVWGSPYVNFGLVFFADNVPVVDANAEPLMINVQNGQKTVVEAKLQLEQFDGESVVYAVLVPRNSRSSEVNTSVFLTSSNPIFLVEEESY